MSLQSLLFLAVVLLPYLVAFTVRFDNGDVAKYKLIKVKDEKSVQFLQGAQAFVRFARVVQAPPNYIFQEGEEVALKIGYADQEQEMRREQKAHDFIQNKARGGYIEGVVKAEIALGESFDLKNDANLVLPTGKSKQEKYFVLIMEPLGLDLITMVEQNGRFKGHVIEAIYDSLLGTLGNEMKRIKIRHGDIKPQNIIFTKSNRVENGIKLVDLGLAIFDGSDLTTCGGDIIYMSPIQHIKQRPATSDDCDVSLAYSIVYAGIVYLPWIVFFEDLQLDTSVQKYDLHYERIWLAKYNFNQDPSTFLKNFGLPNSLEKKIISTINSATIHEVETVRDNIMRYRHSIANSEMNKNQIEPLNKKSN